MTTVLVVDDSPVLRQLIEMFLAPLGLEVHTAANAAQAQDKVESITPDVVLLDVGLPDADGFSVLQWIRSNPAYDATAVFMASGYTDTREIDAAIASGATGYLPKPFTPDDVRSAVLSVVDPDRSIERQVTV